MLNYFVRAYALARVKIQNLHQQVYEGLTVRPYLASEIKPLL